MATYYFHGEHQYLKMHQDKAVSCESRGKIEDHAAIFNISIGAPRNFVIADTAYLGKAKREEMQLLGDFRMEAGDMFVLTPETNTKYAHGVPMDTAADQLRISLVLRHVTKHWVRQRDDNSACWEVCTSNVNEQDGPWGLLPAAKETADQKREGAKRKLEQQREEREKKQARQVKRAAGGEKKKRNRPASADQRESISTAAAAAEEGMPSSPSSLTAETASISPSRRASESKSELESESKSGE